MSYRVYTTAKIWKQAKTPGTKYRHPHRLSLPDGTKKDLTGYGPTAKAATDDLIRKAEAALAALPNAETITVEQLFFEFLQHKRSVKGRKDKTIFDDAGNFRRHIAPSIGSKPIGEVKLHELQNIQFNLTGQGKYRSAELTTILIKSLYRFAAKRYRAEIRSGRLTLADAVEDLDAVRRPPGSKRKAGTLWSLEQVGAFLDLAEQRYRESTRSLTFPFFYTAITAGLRLGELMGLKRTALQEMPYRGERQPILDITEQTTYYGGQMHHDTPKTEHGVRWPPISLGLEMVLRTHMERLDEVAKRNHAWEEHGLLLPSYNGTVVTPRNIYRTRDELIGELGLPKSTVHQMRKVATSYLTRDLLAKGVYSPKLVQRFLGHSSPDVALRTYTLVVEDDYLGAAFDIRRPGATLPPDTPLDSAPDEADDDEL